ncbi:MAG TPA: hypothetical protein VLZ81_03155, partial [Blastocatellia bacterium]|nr:hypothetical protein [Blastocatellia bacterium]
MSRYRIAVFFQMLMAITCLLSGVYARPGQQEPGQPLRLKSELVQFEVRVTDKFGRPVMGLNKNDFSLTEKGKTQDISFFSVVDLTGGSRNRVAPRGDSVSGSTGWEKSSGRTIFIILDPYFIHRTRYWAVDRSLTRLIDEDLSPGDRVGIFSTNGKLAGFQQTTSNKTILLTAIHAFFGKADRLAAEVDPELASAQEDLKLASEPIDAHDISERRQDSLRGFISALKTGRDVPGPKVAIFISESSSVTVISSSPFSRLGSLFTELHKVTQESLDRGMSVFTIDPRGFGPDADAASDERDGTSRRQEGLLGTPEDPSEPATSGSEFRVLDDVDCGCLQKALSLNSFYYR